MKLCIFALIMIFLIPKAAFSGVVGTGGGGAKQLQDLAGELEILKANLGEDRFIYLEDLDLHVKTISTFRTLEGFDGVLLQSADDGSLHTIIKTLED